MSECVRDSELECVSVSLCVSHSVRESERMFGGRLSLYLYVCVSEHCV